jgi:hypothetical protein
LRPSTSIVPSVVFEAHHEAGLGLLGVSLQRAGEAADEGDLQVVRARRAGGGDERRGEGEHL